MSDFRMVTTGWLNAVRELMEDSDYSRFEWGGDVTEHIIHAAAVVAYREDNGIQEEPNEDVVTGAVLDVLKRGWTSYDDPAHLASQDEEGDLFNTLADRFGVPGPKRDELDDYAGLALIKEARDRGEGVVWYNDRDVPGRHHISGVTIFNKAGG